MSNLWRVAARLGMSWFDSDQSGENDEPRQRYPEYEERAAGYAHQIAKAHGVSHEQAAEALDQVQHHHEQGKVIAHPTDYGFESAPSHRSMEATPKEWSLHNWAETPIESVPIHRGVHASQDFIRPHSVAHNLFHPGMHEPNYQEQVGDPDHKPDENDDDPDTKDYHESLSENGADTPRFAERPDGSYDCADGHHRVAADLMLGKTHIPGRVIHNSDEEDDDY